MFRRLLATGTEFRAARILTQPLTRPSIGFQHFTSLQHRSYSSAPELTTEVINERLLEILEGYDKVPKDAKITPETNFSKDLGLDSLDVVEVVMAIEEEFSIGIPDEKADKIYTFGDALKLIENDPHAV